MAATLCDTISMAPFPKPIPLHECRVLAPHFRSTDAQPVRPHTWYLIPVLSACSTIFLMTADLPDPPGPVINIFSLLINLSIFYRIQQMGNKLCCGACNKAQMNVDKSEI